MLIRRHAFVNSDVEVLSRQVVQDRRFFVVGRDRFLMQAGVAVVQTGNGGGTKDGGQP